MKLTDSERYAMLPNVRASAARNPIGRIFFTQNSQSTSGFGLSTPRPRTTNWDIRHEKSMPMPDKVMG